MKLNLSNNYLTSVNLLFLSLRDIHSSYNWSEFISLWDCNLHLVSSVLRILPEFHCERHNTCSDYQFTQYLFLLFFFLETLPSSPTTIGVTVNVNNSTNINDV